MILSETELQAHLDTLTFLHGRRLPKTEDIYHAGMGFFYVSFRRPLGAHEMLELGKKFGRVELVQTIHASRYPRYILSNERE